MPVPRTGPIQLQTHGGEIAWRNASIFERSVRTRRTSGSRPRGTDGFRSLFNGQDLTGWAGAVAGYEVRDGAIVCRPGQGGTLHTEEVYADFVLRLEFNLPPGGNNGLAIRYPGEGDPAYVAMCELQVLDNGDPKYAALDPRQYHGSAYGQVAAHRGYLREPGAWNFQEVTVIGSTIRVELNGTRILDADLSEVTEFMYEPSRFAGRARTSGHVGFAGHQDPVRFRAVSLRVSQ